MSESKIYSAMSAIMSDMGAIGKEKVAGTGNFRYHFRGIDDVYNTLHPLLAKHQVFILPEVLDTARTECTATNNGKTQITAHVVAKVKFSFVAGEDGSSISCIVCGEGMDTGDKATSKALSIAMKYAIFQVFAIPTEDMVDPDADVYEVQPAPQQEQQPVDPLKAKIAAIYKRVQEAGFRTTEDCLAEISRMAGKSISRLGEMSMDDAKRVEAAIANGGIPDNSF